MFKLGNKKLFILLFSLIVFIGLMGLTLGNRESPTWPEKFIADSISWTQGLFYKPAGYIAGFFEDVSNLKGIYHENKMVKETLSRYVLDRAKLNTLEYENARLKEMLQFTEEQKLINNYRYHVAQVVSYSTDPYNHTFRINLGAMDGMEDNMAVVSSEGLVGRLSRVTDFYSTVQLYSNIDDKTNTSKAIAATVEHKEQVSYGIIESYNTDEDVLLMTKIRQEDPLEVGDVIISSGLGQVFPKGILIGTVIAREVGEFGITHTAKVKPAAKLLNLREVFVIEVPDLPGM